MLKVALIGYGYWGKIIRKYIDGSNNFELIKICVNNVKDIQSDIFTNDIDVILSNKSIKAVFICTPVNTHFFLCEKFLHNGMDVFCEKPTVQKKEELATIFEIAKKNNRILYTDYIYTQSPSIKKMRQLINNIGDIHYISGEISQFGNFYEDSDVYGVLMVHLFSILGYILPNVFIEHCEFNHYNELNSCIGDVNIILNNGIKVKFFCSVLGCKKVRNISIYGTRGSILFDMMDTDIKVKLCNYIQDNNYRFALQDTIEFNFDESNNLTYVIEDFYNIILNRKNEENVRITKFVNDILSYNKK